MTTKSNPSKLTTHGTVDIEVIEHTPGGSTILKLPRDAVTLTPGERVKLAKLLLGIVETSLSFDDLRVNNAARCAESFHPLDAMSPGEWFMAASGEMGELANELKKLIPGTRKCTGEGMTPALKSAIGREIADAVTYLDLLASRVGVDMGEAVRAKFNEVSNAVGSDRRL